MLLGRTCRLAVSATGIARAATALVSWRSAITGGKLDFQLDDFVPLFVGTIPLGNGQQLAKAPTIVVRRRRDRGIDWGIFWILIVHWRLKGGARWCEPRIG